LHNIFNTQMFQAIESNGDIVTSMIGDVRIVVSGAPQPLANPALNAVQTAWDLLANMDQVNLAREATCKPGIRIGLGPATRKIIAGYASTQQQATNTCIGDKANLAARL
jgi:class 3 adenylate cyclase